MMRRSWLYNAMNPEPKTEPPSPVVSPPEEPVFIEPPSEPDICGYTIVPGVFCDLHFGHPNNHSNEGNEHREERLAIATAASAESEVLANNRKLSQCDFITDSGRCTLVSGHDIDHRRFFPNVFGDSA